MYSFNNDNIITGYIKQLLHSFNLPKCKVFKDVNSFTSYLGEANGFGLVRKYKNNLDYILYKHGAEIEERAVYLFNKFYPNITDNLPLFNGIYDTTCHKYLGEYLRFLRDYKDINLMSLYNCFSGEILCGSKYKYLIVPVKYNTDYTVAFENRGYSYLLTYADGLTEIENAFKVDRTTKTSYFLKPYKITTGSGEDELIESGNRIGQTKYACFREPLYKLVIRIPLNAENVISVLEGDYTKIKQTFTPLQINFDTELEDASYSKVNIDTLISDLQLLDYHLGQKNQSYPFADRLLEYLTDMVITPEDTISNNIIDAKYKVYERYGNNNNSVHLHTKMRLNADFTNVDRLRFLDAFSQTKYQYKNSYDLLGYVDKEIEECIDDEKRNPKGVSQ